MVDQELLARTEYLAAEDRILKAQLKGRLKLSDAERAVLVEIGHRLGRRLLAEVGRTAFLDDLALACPGLSANAAPKCGDQRFGRDYGPARIGLILAWRGFTRARLLLEKNK